MAGFSAHSNVTSIAFRGRAARSSKGICSGAATTPLTVSIQPADVTLGRWEVLVNEKQIVRRRRLIEQREIETADFRFLCGQSRRYGRGKKEPAGQPGLPAVTRPL